MLSIGQNWDKSANYPPPPPNAQHKLAPLVAEDMLEKKRLTKEGKEEHGS